MTPERMVHRAVPLSRTVICSFVSTLKKLKIGKACDPDELMTYRVRYRKTVRWQWGNYAYMAFCVSYGSMNIFPQNWYARHLLYSLNMEIQKISYTTDVSDYYRTRIRCHHSYCSSDYKKNALLTCQNEKLVSDRRGAVGTTCWSCGCFWTR